MLTDSQRFEAECAHKRAYRTRKDAKRSLRHGLTLYGGPMLRPYRCTWCRRWHIGHSNKAKWLTEAAS